MLALMMVLGAGGAADRAAFSLAEGLAAAPTVFIGTPTKGAGGGVVFKIKTPLKGDAKGEVRASSVDPQEYGSGVNLPKGDRLVLLGDAVAWTFALSSFEARYARPTLELLAGKPSLEAFALSRADESTTARLLQDVFGFEGVPIAARVEAMRQVLARAPPEWEVRFASLPPALYLPELVGPYVEYFTRYPRARFSSATRWTVFKDLEAKAATPYLMRELHEARVTADVNIVHYIFDALEASDREAASCAFTRIVAVDRGLWLGREEANREFATLLEQRLTRLGGRRTAGCPAPPAAVEVAKLYPKASLEQRGVLLRELGLFGVGAPEQVRWALAQAETEKESGLIELALQAAGRLAERIDGEDAASWAEAFTGWFTRSKGSQPHAAPESMARLLRRHPALVAAWLERPAPRPGSYGKPSDFVDSVCASLDFSDRALATRVVDAVLEGKAPWTCVRAVAQQSPVVKERIPVLMKADATKALGLQLAARAGLDGYPMELIAAALKSPLAPVRTAALEALFFQLVGSEAYARGVPYFDAMLDALADEDAGARKAAVKLVVQLSVKGQYPQYVGRAPELATLHSRWLDRLERASGPRRRWFVEGLDEFPDDGIADALKARHVQLKTR